MVVLFLRKHLKKILFVLLILILIIILLLSKSNLADIIIFNKEINKIINMEDTKKIIIDEKKVDDDVMGVTKTGEVKKEYAKEKYEFNDNDNSYYNDFREVDSEGDREQTQGQRQEQVQAPVQTILPVQTTDIVNNTIGTQNTENIVTEESVEKLEQNKDSSSISSSIISSNLSAYDINNNNNNDCYESSNSSKLTLGSNKNNNNESILEVNNNNKNTGLDNKIVESTSISTGININTNTASAGNIVKTEDLLVKPKLQNVKDILTDKSKKYVDNNNSIIKQIVNKNEDDTNDIKKRMIENRRNKNKIEILTFKDIEKSANLVKEVNNSIGDTDSNEHNIAQRNILDRLNKFNKHQVEYLMKKKMDLKMNEENFKREIVSDYHNNLTNNFDLLLTTIKEVDIINNNNEYDNNINELIQEAASKVQLGLDIEEELRNQNINYKNDNLDRIKEINKNNLDKIIDYNNKYNVNNNNNNDCYESSNSSKLTLSSNKNNNNESILEVNNNNKNTGLDNKIVESTSISTGININTNTASEKTEIKVTQEAQSLVSEESVKKKDVKELVIEENEVKITQEAQNIVSEESVKKEEENKEINELNDNLKDKDKDKEKK